MHLEDNGIVLKHRNYSEKQQIVSVFTQNHGRIEGMITRTKLTIAQPGDLVTVYSKARLEQHMGTLKLETKKSNSSLQFCGSERVYALKSMLEILHILLPERHSYGKLWQRTVETIQLFYSLNEAIKAYCLFEIVLIEELGFGLSLDVCAVTGSAENLCFVSPKTGRAVCYELGKPYASKLLPLPKFLNHEAEQAKFSDYLLALQLTGYFLLNHVAHNRQLPMERDALIARIKQLIT